MLTQSSLDYVAVLSKIAQTPDRVVLMGDLGSGQAVAAFTLHRGSSRKDEAFEVIRCTGLTDQQFAAELCGVSDVSGDTIRRGALAKADGGSLCLIGVDDLSQQAQALLVRVLEESSYYPVGASQPQFIDVRVIAAPTHSLRSRIESGQFRMDLYHLLSEQIVHIPSLNDRKADMAQLVLDQLNELGAADRRFTPAAIDILKNHNFTGGFRELRNILKRVTSWFDDKVISEKMLSYVMADGKDESAAKTVSSNDFRSKRGTESMGVSSVAISMPSSDPKTTTLSLKEQEWQYWEGLMAQVQGNKQKAADIAGISLRTLYRRLESAGL
jgi:DNA-binding NtrC family response regulator